MKDFIKIIILILFVSGLSVFAQEAQKFDEFGNVYCEEYLSKMDSVFISLNNDPNSKIHVFVYEGKLTKPKYNSNNKLIGYDSLLPQMGLAKAKIRSMKQFLKLRKIPEERFVFVEAGLLEDFKVEFWLVPAGAPPPKPAPTLKKMKYRKGRPVGFCLGCC